MLLRANNFRTPSAWADDAGAADGEAVARPSGAVAAQLAARPNLCTDARDIARIPLGRWPERRLRYRRHRMRWSPRVRSGAQGLGEQFNRVGGANIGVEMTADLEQAAGVRGRDDIGLDASDVGRLATA